MTKKNIITSFVLIFFAVLVYFVLGEERMNLQVNSVSDKAEYSLNAGLNNTRDISMKIE